ncbi:MAG: OB-fold domain-containing protein, partial [Actinomycetes bacterium]
MSGTLSAPLRLEFDYTRSLGPVLSRFMTGLRDGRLLGARVSDGRVIVPPVEFDPVTHEAVTELVEVGQTGTVTTWTWVSSPVPGQPLEHPFAFALVLLDGADTPILHAVDAGSAGAMSTGMRVRARWREDRQGHVQDFLFEPAADEALGAMSDAEVRPGTEGGADGGSAGEERRGAWPRRPQPEASEQEASGRRTAP